MAAAVVPSPAACINSLILNPLQHLLASPSPKPNGSSLSMNPNPNPTKMYPLCLLLLLALSLLARPANSQPLTLAADLNGLLGLRSTLGLRSKDWPLKTDPCSSWTGVTCRSGRVVALNLSGLRRTRLGRLRPSFSVDGLRSLSRLESLNSTGFPLPGPIPAWFGSQLPGSLSVLVLRSARINDTIPYSLAQLSNLTILDLSRNSISGQIPATIGTIPNLKTLNLSGNKLTGPLPPFLGDLSTLAVLDLSFNLLAGILPDELKNLGRLQELILSNNNLSGSIPDSIWSSKLQILDVSFNNFSGILPNSLLIEYNSNPNASTAVFNLSNNLYCGALPPWFQMFLQRFGVVDIARNYFQGAVSLDGAGKIGSLGLNCFKNAPNQRIPDDCREFYKARGIEYDGPVSPHPAPPPISSSGKRRSQTWKYILAGVLGFAGLVIVVVLVVVFCFMRAAPCTAEHGGIGVRAISFRVRPQPPPPSNVFSGYVMTNGEAFTYEQLVLATSEFRGTNLIKKGHSGELYHGVLESGFAVVVKRIVVTAVRHEGYVAELDLFAKVSHIRLIPFLGQCSEKENEKFLVYKCMMHGDLSSSLYKKPKPEEEGLISLDWITRLKIAVGVAEALCFLHHECNPPLVHRDVQASSILLDDKFEVRLGSLSEVCVQEGDGHQNVFSRLLRRSQASDGRASEHGTSGSPSATCAYDMYCFGKVLLELVTGKLGISGSNDAATAEWLDHTLRCIGTYERESLTKLIDPSFSLTKLIDPSLVLDEDLTQEVWATAVIAKSCLDPKPSRRPSARYVLKALENPLEVTRMNSHSNSARLRTSSSRASWHGAFFGSWRQSLPDSAVGSGPLRRSETVTSRGSLGEHSFAHKRYSTEIFPEPAGDAGEDAGHV